MISSVGRNRNHKNPYVGIMIVVSSHLKNNSYERFGISPQLKKLLLKSLTRSIFRSTLHSVRFWHRHSYSCSTFTFSLNLVIIDCGKINELFVTSHIFEGIRFWRTPLQSVIQRKWTECKRPRRRIHEK